MQRPRRAGGGGGVEPAHAREAGLAEAGLDLGQRQVGAGGAVQQLGRRHAAGPPSARGEKEERPVNWRASVGLAALLAGALTLAISAPAGSVFPEAWSTGTSGRGVPVAAPFAMARR